MQAYTWVNLWWFGDKKSKKTKFPAVVLTDVGFLPEKSGDFPTCFRDDFLVLQPFRKVSFFHNRY